MAGSHIIIYILEWLWLESLLKWDIDKEGDGERTNPRSMRKQNQALLRFTVGEGEGICGPGRDTQKRRLEV